MICKQCGGKFDKHLAECPYCGALNYSGAEEQYMEHLQDIRQDLSEMGDDSKEEYTKHVKKGFVIAIGVVCAVFLIIALLFGLFFLSYNHNTKKIEKEKKAMLLWKSTYYDEMDQMYAEGRYDDLRKFLSDHINDEGYYPYAWEHSDFIMVYQNYTYFLELSPTFQEGDLSDKYWSLYYALYLTGIDDSKYMTFSEEESLIIDDWQKEAEDFLHNTMELSAEEIEEVRKQTDARDSELPDYEKCKKYIQKKYNL